MDRTVQAQKAALLKALHHGPRILVLANAWDVISARIVEEIGFPAVATTSAGIAASAVGLNLEDMAGDDESSQVPLQLQVEKILAVREAAKAAGVGLVINARTDIYLMPIGPAETRFERTVERLRAYAKVGADCVFAPAVKDSQTIAKLAKAVEAPLNILVMPGVPNLKELERLGVARATIGSGLMRAALGTTRNIAKALWERRDSEAMFAEAVPYAEVNRLLGRK